MARTRRGVATRQFDGPPHAVGLQRRHDRAGPRLHDASPHALRETRLLEQDAAGQDELHWRAGRCHESGTRHRVGRQALGRGCKHPGSEWVAVARRAEHVYRHACHVGLARGLGPRDEVFGRVQQQRREDALAKGRPSAAAIAGVNDGPEGAHADVVAAAGIAEDVAPAAEPGGAAIRAPSEAARSCSAHDQHPGGSVATAVGLRAASWHRVFGSHERRLEITGGVARNARPGDRRRSADARMVSVRARTSHADRHCGRTRHRAGDRPQAAGELPIVEKVEIGWPELVADGSGRAAADGERDGASCAGFDAEDERRDRRFGDVSHADDPRPLTCRGGRFPTLSPV